MEPLFAYLISIDRFSPSLLARAAAAPDPPRKPGSALVHAWESIRGAFLHAPPEPSQRSLERSVYEYVRGEATDEEVWATWRFFAVDISLSGFEGVLKPNNIWLKGMHDRPELNGAKASIASFDSHSGKIGINVGFGETIQLSGENISWCSPPTPDMSAVVAILAKVIMAENAHRVCQFLECTRCRLPCKSGETCRVPHRSFRPTELVGPAGRSRNQVHKLCGHCGELEWFVNDGTTAQESEGWCFEGMHTLSELGEDEKRKCNASLADLALNPFLQNQIDGLSDALVTLSLRGRLSPWTVGDEWPGVDIHSMIRGIRQSFAYSLPSLKHLQLSYMSTLKSISIEDLNLPKIESVTFVGMPADCVYSFKSSSLKTFLSAGSENFGECVRNVARGAPALDELTAAGHALGDLVVASNSITVLDLPDAIVRSLTLWTPNLKKLQSGSMEESSVIRVNFLSRHSLAGSLPRDHVRPPLLFNERFSFASDAAGAPASMTLVEDELVDYFDLMAGV